MNPVSSTGTEYLRGRDNGVGWQVFDEVEDKENFMRGDSGPCESNPTPTGARDLGVYAASVCACFLFPALEAASDFFFLFPALEAAGDGTRSA